MRTKDIIDVQKLQEFLRKRTDQSELCLLYSNVFKNILEKRNGSYRNLDSLLLPSNLEYRSKQYFALVEIIQKVDIHTSEQPELKTPELSTTKLEKLAKLGSRISKIGISTNAPPPISNKTPGIEWKIKEVAKAAHLLNKPPMDANFDDELEMRKTYALIYEVYRYKYILKDALDDVDFFEKYPEEVDNFQVVWLFLMELIRRQWMIRDKKRSEMLQHLLGGADSPFSRIERRVWDQRVHFAAAVARIRIKNRAFSLEELLPEHLRDEQHANNEKGSECVTGWVNKFKITNLADFIARMTSLGYTYSSSRQLCALEYRFDRVCQRFITLRPPSKSTPKQAQLFRDGSIVIQEREFCEGASVLCRILKRNGLRGHVAQTHAHNPRATAYLAAQLSDLAGSPTGDPQLANMPDLGRLYVFGAGDKLKEYITILKSLGVEASPSAVNEADQAIVTVWAEPVFEASEDALSGVVAALASPPNSYSAVSDPVDLVCSRGGDLELLEILTESHIEKFEKSKVERKLEEQKKTLDFLMSKPQIQLVLYETHSAHEAENEAMVSSAVKDANQNAKLKHLKAGPNGQSHLLFSKYSQPLQIYPMESIPIQIPKTESVIESGVNKKLKNDGEVVSVTSKKSMKKIPSNTNTDKFSENESSRIAPNTRPDSPRSKGFKFDVIKEFNNEDADRFLEDVEIPKTDLFEIKPLPGLGNGLDLNYILERDGCFLGLIQRQKIIHLDAKFMIAVAEERGLFRQNAAEGFSIVENIKKEEDRKKKMKKKKFIKSFEVSRVAAPTHASLLRSRLNSAPPELQEVLLHCCCSRHARQQRAAGLMLDQACVCDKRHTATLKRGSTAPSARVQLPHTTCRKIYPLRVHDVRFSHLKTERVPTKMF